MLPSTGSLALFAAWYAWTRPLWIVAAGAAVATALMLAVYYLLVVTFPKIAAIARATAKEGWAQPLFWVVLLVGGALLIASPFLPYNTLGEDVKVVKESGLKVIMVLSMFLSVWTASVSIADEIEGRTALTLLSKPVRRHQFIIGKFLGVLAPAFTVFIVLGAVFLATVSYKVVHEARETSHPEPTWQQCQMEMTQIVPAMALAFMETVVITSIAVAISTRLPMLPNLLICFTIYVVGHLTPLLVQSRAGESTLVRFFGQLVAVVLPVLENFDVTASTVKGTPIPLEYLAWAMVYCVLYTTAAMFLALFFFDSRDLG